MARTLCLLSPDRYHVRAKGVCPVALAKHFAVSGRDSQDAAEGT